MVSSKKGFVIADVVVSVIIVGIFFMGIFAFFRSQSDRSNAHVDWRAEEDLFDDAVAHLANLDAASIPAVPFALFENATTSFSGGLERRYSISLVPADGSITTYSDGEFVDRLGNSADPRTDLGRYGFYMRTISPTSLPWNFYDADVRSFEIRIWGAACDVNKDACYVKTVVLPLSRHHGL